MRHPAAQGRTDANQSEIVAAYEELYCRVIDTHKVGQGYPDLTVRVGTRRGPMVQLVEVKTLDGELSKSQQRFKSEWGSCVVVVQTREEVFAHVEAVRRANL
jgi:hypothetical protein